MRSIIDKISLSWVITLLLMGYVASKRIPEYLKNNRMEDSPFPTHSLQTVQRNTIIFPPTDEKRTVTLFWTTWCGPCKFEMDRIQSEINAGKIAAEQIFAIHIGGETSTIQNHMSKHGFTFQALIDSESTLAAALEITMTPSIFLVDEKRKITWAGSGLGITHIWRIKQFLGGI